jgi:PAS domain S-box-containing protein
MMRSPEWDGLWTAIAALAVLVAIDAAVSSSELNIASTYLVAPFIAALAGGRYATLAAGGLAIACCAASGIWNNNFGDGGYEIMLGLVVAGSAFAQVAARARAEARQSMERFQLLDEVAEIADGSLPVAETLDRICDLIVPRLADLCMIDVVSGERVDRVAVRAHGARTAEIQAGLAKRTPWIPENIMRPGEGGHAEPRFLPAIGEETLRQMAEDEKDLEFLRGLGTRSAITLALVARGRRLGALTLITASSGRRYTRSDVRFSRVLAGRASLALDNAGLFSDLQGVEQRMDTVMSVLDEAVVILDRSGSFVFANQAAAETFGFGSPAEMTAADLEDLRERFDLYDEAGGPLAGDAFPAMRALRGERPGAEIVRAISRESGEEFWLRARSRTVPGPDSEPLWAVTALEDVSDLKRAELEQGLLGRTGELLASSIDYRETLDRIAKLAIPELADWCTVHVPGTGGVLEQVAIAHPDPERATEVTRLLKEAPLNVRDESALAQVLRSGEPLVVDDLAPFMAPYAAKETLERLKELGMGSMMVLPMRLAGTVIGTLNFVNDRDRRPFDDFDVRLGRRIAERATVAIENARLATERSEIAETLQHGLLPPPIPSIPGWSVAALYRPAGAENEVGGDFYEVFPFPGGWMVAVGDVTGRGARAAAVTSMARHTLRTATGLTGDPVVALAALNRALLGRPDMALCSVVLVALPSAPEVSTVEMAAAGHPAPILLRAGGAEEAACEGPVLGAFSDASWTPGTAEVRPGEMLIAYTDGVTEANSGADRFGEQRLREELSGTATPAAAVSRVEDALERFTRGELDDDAAVVAVMREQPARLPDAVRGSRVATAG